MRAGIRALPADKVAVRGRDRALPRRDDVAIDAGAHRTAGFAPFETGAEEHFVEPFPLSRALRGLRSGHDPGADIRRDLAPGDDTRGLADVREPAIGAGADEHPVDRRPL